MRQFQLDEGEDPRSEIARLESHIEHVSESLERCRKIKLFSQLAIVGGSIWIGAATLGFLEFDPIALILAISAVIGGIVGFGSNTTTTGEFVAAMKDAEALRARLIATLDLHVIGGTPERPQRTLH